ncbi:hypothetical protein CsatA_001269 [Cannabis sativa]
MFVFLVEASIFSILIVLPELSSATSVLSMDLKDLSKVWREVRTEYYGLTLH